MELVTLCVGPVGTNAYLACCDGKNAFAVDPGDEPQEILRAAREKGWQIQNVLLTHGHFDHIGAVEALRLQGAKVYICAFDAAMLSDPVLNAAQGFGLSVQKTRADQLLKDGDRLSLFGAQLQVIGTPGHTPGGVCYYHAESHTLFAGDTLFAGSIGRADLPGGNEAVLLSSIRNKLYCLPEETKVLPGHGAPTEIRWEKRNNLFVRDYETANQ